MTNITIVQLVLVSSVLKFERTEFLVLRRGNDASCDLVQKTSPRKRNLLMELVWTYMKNT